MAALSLMEQGGLNLGQHHWVNLLRPIHFFIILTTFPAGEVMKGHISSHKTRKIRRNLFVPGGGSHKAEVRQK